MANSPKPVKQAQPLMPHATATWLVENTGLTFAQIAAFCQIHVLEVQAIADELGGQVTVAKVNIDDSPMTPSKLGVKGIPTLMLFKDGQMASMKVGAMPKGKIVEWLAEAGVKAEG